MSAYLTTAALKTTLGITVATYDGDVLQSIQAASGAIDLICQRGRNAFNEDGTTSSRYYSPVSMSLLEIDDLATDSGLIVASRDDGGNVDTNDGGLNTWTEFTDFVLEPLNAAAGTSVDVWPYERIRVMPLGAFAFNTFFPRSVKVTGKFGWPQIPSGVLEVCSLLAARLFKMKREAPLGIMAFQETAVRVARADANMMGLLSPYMKHAKGVG